MNFTGECAGFHILTHAWAGKLDKTAILAKYMLFKFHSICNNSASDIYTGQQQTNRAVDESRSSTEWARQKHDLGW